MPTLKDTLIWRAVWTPITLNTTTQESSSVQEAINTVPTEPIKAPTDAVTSTVVLLLFVRIVAVNVWAATLSLAAKGMKYGKKEIFF